ncbi:MAG: winged helix-turn-helix transcriptional regulator [Flavobacteriales bacterium]|nr:winged helix-turn-helix transcriptional regulator [Flavobacteriales bacterium]MCB9174038.1 winged helix-turn-helix transcriptional regulator [Flavobacteriales bacterium]
MGATKSNQFTTEQNKLADLYKALAHPARIAILQLLIQKQACICGDIVDELPLSQSTISQHLKALKTAGIIQGDISGVKTCYCINQTIWSEMDDLTKQFLNSYKYIEKCC